MSDECGKHNAYFGFCEQCVEEAAEQAFTAGERAATERIIYLMQVRTNNNYMLEAIVEGNECKAIVKALKEMLNQTPRGSRP